MIIRYGFILIQRNFSPLQKISYVHVYFTSMFKNLLDWFKILVRSSFIVHVLPADTSFYSLYKLPTAKAGAVLEINLATNWCSIEIGNYKHFFSRLRTKIRESIQRKSCLYVIPFELRIFFTVVQIVINC